MLEQGLPQGCEDVGEDRTYLEALRDLGAYIVAYWHLGEFAPVLHRNMARLLREAEGRAEAASLGREQPYERGPLLFTRAQLVQALGPQLADKLARQYGAEVTYAHLVPDEALFRKLAPGEKPRRSQQAVGAAAVAEKAAASKPAAPQPPPAAATVPPAASPAVVGALGGWDANMPVVRAGNIVWYGVADGQQLAEQQPPLHSMADVARAARVHEEPKGAPGAQAAAPSAEPACSAAEPSGAARQLAASSPGGFAQQATGRTRGPGGPGGRSNRSGSGGARGPKQGGTPPVVRPRVVAGQNGRREATVDYV